MTALLPQTIPAGSVSFGGESGAKLSVTSGADPMIAIDAILRRWQYAAGSGPLVIDVKIGSRIKVHSCSLTIARSHQLPNTSSLPQMFQGVNNAYSEVASFSKADLLKFPSSLEFLKLSAAFNSAGAPRRFSRPSGAPLGMGMFEEIVVGANTTHDHSLVTIVRNQISNSSSFCYLLLILTFCG